MSETYERMGSLIVCGDYEGDLEAIAEVLNGYAFDQDDDQEQRFVVHDGRIEPEPLDIYDPNRRVLPIRWSEDSEVSLAELSRAIAPLLKRGTLELVSIGHIKLERLAIRSDGWVQRQIQEYDSFPRDKWRTRSTGTYQPPHATRNTDTIAVS